jgi:hypothetical protein
MLWPFGIFSTVLVHILFQEKSGNPVLECAGKLEKVISAEIAKKRKKCLHSRVPNRPYIDQFF